MLEEREEYLVRKIAKLLHVAHADFIDEKIKVKEKMKGPSSESESESDSSSGSDATSS